MQNETENNKIYATCDDRLLFEGFSSVIEQTWVASVKPAIDRGLRDIAGAGKQDTLPDSIRDVVVNGSKDDATPEDEIEFNRLVDYLSQSILDKTADIGPQAQKMSPGKAIRYRYRALEEQGFSGEQVDKIASDFGDQEYLSKYVEAVTQGMLQPSPFSEQLGKLANDNNATVVRYSLKREEVELTEEAASRINDLRDIDSSAREFLDGNTFSLLAYENSLLSSKGLNIAEENTFGMNMSGTVPLRTFVPEDGRQVTLFDGKDELAEKMAVTSDVEVPFVDTRACDSVSLCRIYASEDKGCFERAQLEEQFASEVRIEGRSVNTVNVWDDRLSELEGKLSEAEKASDLRISSGYAR